MIVLDDVPVTLEQMELVARGREPLVLGEPVREKIATSRRTLEHLLARGDRIYGTTTGVGGLSHLDVPPERQADLSRNIILSHACGVGPRLSDPLVRAIMFGAVMNLSQGYSGVRLELVERLVELLNRGVVPCVPSQGSVGSLTHMAHVGLALMGQGQARLGERVLPAAEALAEVGLEPFEMAAGEGLSMVSGTPSIVGIGGLAVLKARRLLRWADLAAAMSYEALQGNPGAFDERVHWVRPHPGQMAVASNLRRLTAGSQLLGTHRLQDCLSLRTTPQVHGACRETVHRAAETLQRELNSATDNPLIFEEGAVSACNAHGEPMAQCLDVCTTALAELGNIAERRTDRMLNYHVSGLPPFLCGGGGLNSGLMIPHYVSAYLVAENKILAHPVSVDSIPMSAFQEDHVNMGTMSALMAYRVATNVERILAVELLSAAHALEHLRPLVPGAAVAATVGRIWEEVRPVTEDRALSADIQKLADFVGGSDWIEQLERDVGAL